jgi:hypothetical protein
MPRKRIALSQFAVSTERDDGGVALTHSYRLCDWETWVDGDTPLDILRTAREHARACDGKPQPRPERPGSFTSSLISAMWGKEIKAALGRSLQFEAERPMVAIPGA